MSLITKQPQYLVYGHTRLHLKGTHAPRYHCVVALSIFSYLPSQHCRLMVDTLLTTEYGPRSKTEQKGHAYTKQQEMEETSSHHCPKACKKLLVFDERFYAP